MNLASCLRDTRARNLSPPQTDRRDGRAGIMFDVFAKFPTECQKLADSDAAGERITWSPMRINRTLLATTSLGRSEMGPS